MKFSDIEKLFIEKCNAEEFVCTKKDFDCFVNYGFILGNENNFYSRYGKKLNVVIQKVKSFKMNLDFSYIIDSGIAVSKSSGKKLIYYMSKSRYDECLNKGLILEMSDNKYYRLFDKELWLVKII